MQVYFNGYTDEKVVKGRNSYNKMVISYSYQGQSKTQQIMSFANPAVYAAVQGFKEGDLLDVEIVKNDAGYNTWASVKLSDGGGKVAADPNAPKSVPAARTSTYETPEERAKKQVYIIKQSCLAQAVTYSLGVGVDKDSTEQVLNLAQEFVDWVLDDGESKGSSS